MLNLQTKPFNLTTQQINWVNETLAHLTDDEKIGQLFIPIGYSSDKKYLDQLLRHHIGGLFFRSGHIDELRNTFRYAQARSKVPLLTPANLEFGGTGAVIEGSDYAHEMAVSAAGSTKYAYTLGRISALEAKAAGINWGFAPVVDLDLNFRSPIINVRSFGDDPDRVIENAKAYIKAFNEQNMMTSIKHFPGDGVDERDQHLLTSINQLPFDAWWRTYGKIYRSLIDDGVRAVMIGHIALPSFAHDEVPASLNPRLLKDLLREKLGFNGLIITDATPMVGFATEMPRKNAIPAAIQNGNDMILFNHDFEEDVNFMKAGLADGRLTHQRLDEAVMRILAAKASLNLNEGVTIPDGELPDFKHEQSEVADHAITLVRDDERILPISPIKTKKVLLEILGAYDSNRRVAEQVKSELENRGFEVVVYVPETNFVDLDSVEKFKSKYDLVLYVANVENSSNQTTARINWHTLFGLGNNLPWFAREVPTVLVSFGNPYHQFDLPMVHTVINAYDNFPQFIQATMQKLAGESTFEGQAPTDVSCRNLKLKGLMQDENH